MAVSSIKANMPIEEIGNISSATTAFNLKEQNIYKIGRFAIFSAYGTATAKITNATSTPFLVLPCKIKKLIMPMANSTGTLSYPLATIAGGDSTHSWIGQRITGIINAGENLTWWCIAEIE